MFCTSCGVTLREEDRFCSRCGKPTAANPVPAPSRSLALDKRNKKIAGVCAGFARHLDADVTLVRIIVLVFALATGVGFIFYLIAWLLMPSDASCTAVVAEPRPQGAA